MADIASIARPYAKAIFELAQEAADFASWKTALAQLSSIAQDQEFSSLLTNPQVSSEQVSELLLDLSKSALPQGGENFLRLLVSNGRVEVLPEIEQQFSQLVSSAENTLVAHVATAIALTDEQKSGLSKALEQRLNAQVSIEETVDPELLGGAIIRCGDLVIDGSAKGRVEKLAVALA